MFVLQMVFVVGFFVHSFHVHHFVRIPLKHAGYIYLALSPFPTEIRKLIIYESNFVYKVTKDKCGGYVNSTTAIRSRNLHAIYLCILFDEMTAIRFNSTIPILPCADESNTQYSLRFVCSMLQF